MTEVKKKIKTITEIKGKLNLLFPSLPNALSHYSCAKFHQAC